MLSRIQSMSNSNQLNHKKITVGRLTISLAILLSLIGMIFSSSACQCTITTQQIFFTASGEFYTIYPDTNTFTRAMAANTLSSKITWKKVYLLNDKGEKISISGLAIMYQGPSELPGIPESRPPAKKEKELTVNKVMEPISGSEEMTIIEKEKEIYSIQKEWQDYSLKTKDAKKLEAKSKEMTEKMNSIQKYMSEHKKASESVSKKIVYQNISLDLKDVNPKVKAGDTVNLSIVGEFISGSKTFTQETKYSIIVRSLESMR